MAAERPVITGWAWTCEYRYISSEHQHQTRRMRSLLTPTHNTAIALQARANRMETSAAVYAGSGWSTRAARMRAVRCDAGMWQKGEVGRGRTALTVVVRVAPDRRRVSIRDARVSTGQT
jgi:hypothetical protein